MRATQKSGLAEGGFASLETLQFVLPSQCKIDVDDIGLVRHTALLILNNVQHTKIRRTSVLKTT